ncbi:LOW QUALITY PROTEIN: S-adenosyl-L-methionine-dependent methyltransferase [Copromyces sp. CBS 386.78]|nr:LOW QUALITY PROTEIN: S-adenosyl-L-methionine-dependent methyltransferase [Copromyces sp. CBS 386.78]
MTASLKEEAKSPTPGPASPASSLLSGAYWADVGLPEADLENDLDLTLGSDVESSIVSISSSIFRYRTINGCTYYSDSVTDGEFWGPNDEKANEVLDIFHHVWTLTLNGNLYTAPITDDPENIIDIGTGTGLWALDVADKFPNCSVIGTDISPIQPSWVPPNLCYEIDDASKEWAHKDNHFDFVHIRWLTSAIKDWIAVYKEAYRCLKPGGWIEHMDCSGQAISEDDSDGMKAAGFVNLTKKDYLIPVSPWPKDKKMKEIGLYFRMTWLLDIEGICQFMFSNVMGWEKHEISTYIAHLKAEMKNPNIHRFVVYRVVYAQKPLDTED